MTIEIGRTIILLFRQYAPVFSSYPSVSTTKMFDGNVNNFT